MRKKAGLVLFLTLAALFVGGCSSVGEKGGSDASSHAEEGTENRTGATGTVPETGAADGVEDQTGETGANPGTAGGGAQPVYDASAGNIYTEVTGDYALTVGVNQSEPSALDTILLSDAASCEAYGVTVKDPIYGEDIYGEGHLQLSASQNDMTFQVAVDPKSFNYITVKLWGGDKGYNSALILWGKNKFGEI